MQDRLSPREARSTYDVYAKPVLMSQPPETKVKQRQRLLSDEQTKQDKQDSRPPTPPGKLQMSKISSMLQSSSKEGSTVPRKQPSPANRHLREDTAIQNGHARDASEAPQHDQAVRQLPDDMPSPSTTDRSTIAVAEAIAQFEKRIGQRNEESSVGKLSSVASPTEEGDKPLSHRSSQRAEALRQLRELWFSDEAEQPGTPDLPRGTELPSPLHAAARICNGHAECSSAPPQTNSTESPAPRGAAAVEGSAANGHDDVSPHQQPSQVSRSEPGLCAAAREELNCASPLPSRDEKEATHKNSASNKDEHEAYSQHEAKSNGNSQHSEQRGHERDNYLSSPSGTQNSYHGDLPTNDSSHLQNDSQDVATQCAERELQGNAEEPLPVSVGAARVSSDPAALAYAPRLPSSRDMTGQLPKHEESSAASSCELPAKAMSQTGEPAWVTGFRTDMGRAMETPFLHPGLQPLHSAQSTPGVSPAAGAAYARHKLSWQGDWAETEQKVPSRACSPWNTPVKASGVSERSALPVPLRSSHSRTGLMQGWRSIMQGSPQQSTGKSLSAVAAQKSGLDLAWRLNEVVHELSSCLARTAEQQQLLTDAARLLTHGEDEDTDYAAEKLHAADELRQWSEAAQCSSIACLVGILKELQHSRQTRMEEVHLDTSAWLAVLGSGRPLPASRAS